MIDSIEIGLEIAGGDYLAEIEYEITAKGERASWDSPGWGAEYRAEVKSLAEDLPSGLRSVDPIPQWLKEQILKTYESDIQEAIEERCAEERATRGRRIA